MVYLAFMKPAVKILNGQEGLSHDLSKKANLIVHFKKYFEEKNNVQSDPASAASKLSAPNLNKENVENNSTAIFIQPPRVQHESRILKRSKSEEDHSIVFLLNNGTTQVNFADHTKISVSLFSGQISYTDADGGAFSCPVDSLNAALSRPGFSLIRENVINKMPSLISGMTKCISSSTRSTSSALTASAGAAMIAPGVGVGVGVGASAGLLTSSAGLGACIPSSFSLVSSAGAASIAPLRSAAAPAPAPANSNGQRERRDVEMGEPQMVF